MMQEERIGRIHLWCRVGIGSHCQENKEKERTDEEDEDAEIKFQRNRSDTILKYWNEDYELKYLFTWIITIVYYTVYID